MSRQHDNSKKLAPLLRKLRTRFGAAVLPIAPFAESHASHAVVNAAQQPAISVSHATADLATPASAAQPNSSGGSNSSSGSTSFGSVFAKETILLELVFALLAWNASTKQAHAALSRIGESVVDFNELRVCDEDEIEALFACDNYHYAAERAARIRAALNDVFRRQHGMTLAGLREAPKREARHFLESIDGVPRYAAARVACGVLGVHAVPVDDRLRDLLARESVVAQSASVDEASNMLERAIASAESHAVVALLFAWSDAEGSKELSELAGDNAVVKRDLAADPHDTDATHLPRLHPKKPSKSSVAAASKQLAKPTPKPTPKPTTKPARRATKSAGTTDEFLPATTTTTTTTLNSTKSKSARIKNSAAKDRATGASPANDDDSKLAVKPAVKPAAKPAAKPTDNQSKSNPSASSSPRTRQRS